MSIVIFSRPVHSGKTTLLRQWCIQQNNIRGILMPDINGSRKILNLHTKEIFDIECMDAASTKEPLTSVGRFHFYTSAFEKTNQIISEALTQSPDWLVIDEAGKLELSEKGFYVSIVKAVEYYSENSNTGNLLLAVRESLCRDVIDFFKLKEYKIIHHLENII